MIDISKISISYEETLLRLGFSRSKTKMDEKTQILIQENLELAQKLLKPKAVLAFENIEVKSGEVLFESGFKIASQDIAQLLKDCHAAYGIAITIGAALERKRDELAGQKEVFKALILDAAGSVAAEECIETACRQLEKGNEEDGRLTRRFSCGYGDWHLDNQRDFLDWIGAKSIGISASNSFIMRPEKSISALIGKMSL
jgi:hypothetical protein